MKAEARKGKVVGVNGNMVTVAFEDRVMQNEVAYVAVGDERLKSEVIRVRGKRAELQVFEDTIGIKIGDTVEFTNELLSVELGPGLLGQIFDGLQNPLPQLAQRHGFFLKRGAYLDPLDADAAWEFTPGVKAGDRVRAGDPLGTVPEKIFQHWIMVPFALHGELEVCEVAAKGNYTIKEVIAKLLNLNANHLLNYPLQSVSTGGVAKLMIPVDSLISLKSIKPDLAGIKNYRAHGDCRGFYPFTSQTMEAGSDFHARQFNPLIGIDEDPITGIAADALGCYVQKYGLTDKDQLVIEQGYILGKGGKMYVNLRGGVKVGGYAVTFGKRKIPVS